jgi:hypothetical protein
MGPAQSPGRELRTTIEAHVPALSRRLPDDQTDRQHQRRTAVPRALRHGYAVVHAGETHAVQRRREGRQRGLDQLVQQDVVEADHAYVTGNGDAQLG